MVKNLNPGPPESFSGVAQRPAAKSATLPAQSARLSPGLVVSKEILRTALALTLTALPVRRYFWPTVPEILNASALLAPTSATTEAQTTAARVVRFNIFRFPPN